MAVIGSKSLGRVGRAVQDRMTGRAPQLQARRPSPRDTERVSAAVNLHAVLRNLEDLVMLDEEARRLIAKARVRVRFDVPGIRTGHLAFVSGTVTTDPVLAAEDLPEVRLAFVSPKHFNAMVSGKGMPIPTRGITNLSFLQGPFTALTTRLEYFLRPGAEVAADPELARVSTILTAYTAFFALAEIGNLDPIGRQNASRIPDGVVRVDIVGGPTVSLAAEGGRLTAHKGELPGTRAWMTFDSIETAGGILTGAMDSYGCIGNGSLAVRGFVPMVDNMNKLLTQVSTYLK